MNKYLICAYLTGYDNWFKNSSKEYKELFVKLDLGGCNLTEIPESVFQLRNLEILILDENHIKNIPRNIFKLQKLKVLRLQNNEINFGNNGEKEWIKKYFEIHYPNINIML